MKKVGQSRAPDEVMHQLADLIRRGEVKVGQRLPSEKNLAETFGVSRPVVREAFRGLRSLGLIQSRMGSGSYVSDGNALRLPLLLGRYTAPELHEVRTHLEVPGAALAARRATEDQIAELLGMIRQMSEPQGHRPYAELDATFHAYLAACTGNSVHARLIADLGELIVENSDLALSANVLRQAQATREHRRVAEAVARRDPEAAEAAMLVHLSRVARALGYGLGDVVATATVAGGGRTAKDATVQVRAQATPDQGAGRRAARHDARSPAGG
jgi:GntR family transcriptional repressor for pyruvate dehydrogenase complex